MDTYIRFGGSIERTEENYKITAVVSLSRANHVMGPRLFNHGTLLFVRRGAIEIEIAEADFRNRVGANHFILLPPGLVRSTRTDTTGAMLHALLLEKAKDLHQLLPYVRLPEKPVVIAAKSPAHVATLFQSAENQWLKTTDHQDLVGALGSSYLIISQWMESWSESRATPHMEGVVRRVVQYIGANYHRADLSIDELTGLTPWSRRYFFRAFKQVTGMTPQTYIQHVRLNRAIDLLRLGEFAVKDVAHMCGYEDAAYFSPVFAQRLGRPPSAFLGVP